MKLSRRATVALFVVATAAVGAGVATTSGATPPCDQAAQACQTYDRQKENTLTFLIAANAACQQNVPGATGCGELATADGTAYSIVFYPYRVCYGNVPEVGSGCIGPL